MPKTPMDALCVTSMRRTGKEIAARHGGSRHFVTRANSFGPEHPVSRH